MNHWIDQLILVPVLLPLVAAAVLVLLNERRHELKLAINFASTLGLLVVALALIRLSDGEHWTDGIGVYLAANWAAPFGIALVADRLAAAMLLLTAVLALAGLLYSASRWSRIGVHFHSLFQFLLMGLNGAFLTGDLFNLFVFFEVMLAASYGLLLHGYNATRIRAGMQYVVINLVGSLFFLIGIALIYAGAGTLNMADLAARIGALGVAEREILEIGAGILALAFLTKSAMWPLCFWLPTSYAAASPPAAAMMALMTKVGAYVILRLWLLLFSAEAGASAGFGAAMLFWGGVLTLGFGAIGLLASQQAPGRMAGYCAIVSSGTLLAAISFGEAALISAALFYLISSTLALAAFLLLLELIERIRTPVAAMLALTMEAFAIEDVHEDDTLLEPAGEAIPAAMAFLGFAFVGCVLVIAGVPPLSGFIAKFSLFHALLNPAANVSLPALGLMAAILTAGLAGLVALMRFGVRTFWSVGTVQPPRLRVSEAVPVSLLLLACVAMTVQVGPLMAFLDRTSATLQQPQAYVAQVLGKPAIPGPTTAGAHP
jgi:multicomponent K+:H+ antiporter subunit D